MMPRCCLLLLLLLVQTIVVLVESQDTKIKGGFEVNIADVPWQVSIHTIYGHHCGGVIISDRWVLSAAHCMLKKTHTDFKLMIGSSVIQNNETVMYDVELVVSHDGYDESTVRNDISALKTSRLLEFGATVKTVRLPEAGATRPQLDTELRVSGWGVIEGGEQPTTLRAVDVKLLQFAVCKVTFKDADEATQVCAGDKGKGPCNMDSGGPLVQGDLLVGLVSYGPRCRTTEANFGVYTDVTAYRDWIRNVTAI